MQKKNEISSNETRTVKNEIHYAKGFEIYRYKGYSIVKLPHLGLEPKKILPTFYKKKTDYSR
jgi:iron complex transport system substrate-binding protein